MELDHKKNSIRVDLLYRQPLEQKINIRMLVGVFDAEDLNYSEVEETYYKFVNSSLERVTLEPLITWDYIEMLGEYDVSYVVCRDQDVYSKFSEDPKFRLVFNGGNVAVFQVVK